MALSTHSIFYYGLEITKDNFYLNFLEPNAGNIELTAQVAIGVYNYDEFETAIKTAMDLVGDNTYTLSVDRNTRIMSITADGDFDLLVASGSQIGLSPFNLLGFVTAIDRTGSAAYFGDTVSGFSYEPQFVLQDYTPSENNQKYQDSSLNKSATGLVEQISFGLIPFYLMSINFITNLPQDGHLIKNNPNGVSDARDFFKSIIRKGKFEFMPDINSRNTFSSVILESLASMSNGSGFKLNEMVGQNLPEFYDVKGITLRDLS